MERYEAYKDSGVEWIGEIPEGWIVARLGNCLALNQGGVWGDDPVENEGTVVLRSTEQTLDGNWRIDNPAIRNLENEPHIDEKLLAIDDLLVTKSSGSELHIGKTTIVDSNVASLNCTYSNFMQRLRVNDLLKARLCWYLLNSDLARSQYCYLQNSTSGIGNLNADTIASIYIPIPPQSMQNCIVDYLDARTAEIDALVADCEREVGLLQEYRKAVISEAVTKGLDPDAPMKDSGVEWIGEIPKGWQTARIKQVCGKVTDGSHFSPDVVDEGFPYITATNIRGRGLDYSSAKLIDEESYNQLVKTGCRPKAGDVFMVKDGATTGRAGMMIDDEPCVILSSVAMMRPMPICDSDYLFYSIQSNNFQEQVLVSMAGSAMPRTTLDKLVEYFIALPSITEQSAISAHLDAMTAVIDSLIEARQSMADRLREYCRSLIFEAVTGKFKVPGVE